LLGIGMVPDPWVISANRKRSNFRRIVGKTGENISIGAIAGQQHSVSVLFKHVAVEAVVAPVGRPALAPMIRPHCADLKPADLRLLTPPKFSDVPKADRREQLGALVAGYNHQVLWQRFKRRKVQMVHMRVRDKQYVDSSERRRR